MSKLPLVLLALAIATPAEAGARTSTSYTQKGEFVSASYYDTSSTGCSSTFVEISGWAGTTHTRSSGAPTTSTDVYAYVGSYDYCLGTFEYYYGTLTSTSLSGSGATGSISGSGDLYDAYTGAAYPVTISATVAADGGSYSGKSFTRGTSPGANYFYRANGSYTYGAASITLNGTTYTQALGGTFGKSTSGTVTIISD